ncbi:MAG: pilus assembly protein TadG-related protein [Anaerolineales bacterium]|jgi:hypothetical protein
MNRRGQIVIIIAILIPVVLLFLAVAVDGGRLYTEKAQLQRGLQSGADAGMSLVAEQMVTLAVARQTAVAQTQTPTSPFPTATPFPDDVVAWLTDDDRATLVSAPIRASVQAEALAFAERNGIDAADEAILELDVVYPQLGYDPYNPSLDVLRLRISARRHIRFLLAGLLGHEFVEFTSEAVSELRQRK